MDEWFGRVAKCCNTPLVKREKRRVKRKCVPSGHYLNYFRKKIPFLFTFHSSLFTGAVAFCNSPFLRVPQKKKMGIDFGLDLCYNTPCVQVVVHILGCRQAVRHQTLTLAFVGSNPAIPAKYDPLAQPVEQLPFKQWVRGSSPRRVTRKKPMRCIGFFQ